MSRFLTSLVIIVIVFAAGYFGWTWYAHRATAEAPAYRTAEVGRGDLVATITATGTLEPEEVIDVGAQVAGQILQFGTDENGQTIDYGSTVKKGTILARIDDSLYLASVNESKAQLTSAQAGVTTAQATIDQLQAKLDQATRDWKRAQAIGPSDALSQTSYDAYRAAYETSVANLEVGEAQLEQAKAAVLQAQAGLYRAQRNLDYCTITSPVEGVIIDRRVNIGQTVVASLNAPSLFLLAKDLKKMQVWVSVNEADIGHIHPDQSVTFTVDAQAGRIFHGTVRKVRLNAVMTQNVVTYIVEVQTDNTDGSLLPYQTANAVFEVARHDDVLKVPNAALRWFPQASQVAPGVSEKNVQNLAENQAVLWVEDGSLVRPLIVATGLTDGVNTEVSAEQLHAGTPIVIGDALPNAGTTDGQSTNPFLPNIHRARTNSSDTQKK